jgi:hypothetical protein
VTIILTADISLLSWSFRLSLELDNKQIGMTISHLRDILTDD